MFGQGRNRKSLDSNGGRTARAALARAVWLAESKREERERDAVEATVTWADLRNVTSPMAMTGHYADLIDRAQGSYH